MQGDRLSIRQRLWIMLSAVFLMGVIFMAVDFHQYQNQLVEEKKQQLSALVESQASLLSQLLSNGGDLQEGLSAINGSRYHGEEYFFVINEQLIMKMHPFKPVLNETSVSKVRDPDGVYLFREMKKAVEKGGTGFVNYKWPRPGSDEPVSKLSAITPVAGSDLYIGTGEYIDDIQAVIWSRGSWTLLCLLIWGGFMLICSRYITAAISKPIRRIEETMANLAEGDLSFECERSGVPEFDRISVAINKMRSRLSELLSRIRDDSDRLNREADIVARSTSEVSAGSDSQYRELDQLSVAMTEMVQTTQVLAGNARDAAQRMTEVTDAASSGANSVSGLLSVDIKRIYERKNIRWNNEFIGRYGINDQKGQEVRKTDDQLEINSTFGYRKDTLSNWYSSAKMNFSTQFSNGYNYPDRSNKISTIMAPAYLFIGAGSEYNNEDLHLNVYASPLTMRSTFVLDQELANSGAFGVEPAVYDEDGNLIKEGDNVRTELGILLTNEYRTQLFENIGLSNKLSLYTDYINNFGNIDVNWELNFNFKVNQYVLAKLGSHLKYDDDIKVQEENAEGELVDAGPRIQWKQQLGIGVIVEL